jgi:hypothetical protein
VTIVESTVALSADAVEQTPRSDGEVRLFLAAIATVLRETVTAFESTVGRITEITVTRPGRADRDLVVALQDFDRLQQEFATLSEVIARLSLKPETDGPAAAADEDVLAAISIADLKGRLARHLRTTTADAPVAEGEDVEF